MSELKNGLTKDEMATFFAKFAQITALLLVEKPATITEFEQDKEVELGVTRQQYIDAVQLKNTIVVFFGTMANSLISVENKDLHILVTEDGDIDALVMRAISYRFMVNLTFPEFSIPLAREFKKIASTIKMATKKWQLVDGEKRFVYFQAIGEKQVVQVLTSSSEAEVINLFGEKSS